MKNTVSAVIMLLFGSALTLLASTDRLLLYVRGSARRWVLLAGVAIIVLAGWTLGRAAWQAVRRREVIPQAPQDYGGHTHSGASRASLLVLLPALVVIAVAPPALGSYTASRAQVVHFTTAPPAVVPASGELSLLTLSLYADQDPERIIGKTLTIVGFVQQSQPSGFILTRLVITCCAADAFAVRVKIDWHGPALARGQWVRLSGTFTGVAQSTPQVAATSVQTIAAPADPYG